MEASFTVQNPTDGNRTFGNDDYLPPLPVPELKVSLQKYLDSCKAVLSANEYETTEKVVQKFAKNEGPVLQKLLQARAKERRNWLEEWWLDGYLEYRGPLSLMNMSGSPHHEFWRSAPGSQIERSALSIFVSLKFWLLLREEKFVQMKNNKGNPLSMNQCRFMFNTCRVPQKCKDQVFSYFKTMAEGYSPSHVIVFYRNRMYKVQAISEKTGELETPSNWYNVFSKIKANNTQGPGISLLTELGRDTWAEARTHLMTLSSKNAINIHDIESAILCFGLLDDNPESDSGVMDLCASGSYGNRWADKLNCFCTDNGHVSFHSEHTPAEGMIIMALVVHNDIILREKFNLGKWNEKWGNNMEESPVELTFDIDDKIERGIVEGWKIAQDFETKSQFLLFTFEDFGKFELKDLNVHSAAFVEICIQLAYMRRHGKPGTTYETAQTRIFYHGRTETIRTCTPETVKFCAAVIKNTPHKKELFKKAHDKYIWLMEECKAGKGCDRHLLGLAAIAKENGYRIPEIFTDPSYKITGGGANFVLSTTYGGHAFCDGAVSPMMEDGYGAFFGTLDHAIRFALTTYNPSPGIDGAGFADCIRKALRDVYQIVHEPTARL